MGNDASASRFDRRNLLMGGAAAGAAAALGGLADDSDADESTEYDGSVLIGTIAAHGATGVDLDAADGRSVTVQPVPGAEIVQSDGSPKKLSDFAVGDGIAVDVAGGVRGNSGRVVGARRVTPCVLGSRSDVER